MQFYSIININKAETKQQKKKTLLDQNNQAQSQFTYAKYSRVAFNSSVSQISHRRLRS